MNRLLYGILETDAKFISQRLVIMGSFILSYFPLPSLWILKENKQISLLAEQKFRKWFRNLTQIKVSIFIPTQLEVN